MCGGGGGGGLTKEKAATLSIYTSSKMIMSCSVVCMYVYTIVMESV